MYIQRIISDKILYAHKYFPVIMITGARQVGKSTLCRHLFPDYKYVNMEDASNKAKVNNDIKAFLEFLGEKVIIDEAQATPQIFSQIQVNVDENPSLRYILTGSNNFHLMTAVSQSMAGRVALFVLPPLSLKELSSNIIDDSTELLEFRGFYPSVITNQRPADIFYENYFTTYIERDIRSLIQIGNLSKFDMFVRLLASRMGSEVNASALAGEVGVSSVTISQWINLLEASYLIFPLRPYYRNISKRLSKMPKWYFYDTGLAVHLLNIENPSQLISHPLKGNIFENMVVSEMVKDRMNNAKSINLSFYRERTGKEVDVIKENFEGIEAYEIKSAKTFNSEFTKNLEYLKTVLGEEVKSAKIIYDGESFPPIAINFREI